MQFLAEPKNLKEIRFCDKTSCGQALILTPLQTVATAKHTVGHVGLQFHHHDIKSNPVCDVLTLTYSPILSLIHNRSLVVNFALRPS